jgi:two-component system chemotaxis response regulator CheY
MGKKIVVVDDSETVRQQVAAALTGAGYQIVEARDGLDGLRVLEEHPDAKMVICDLNMPNMGGLDMISKLRTVGKTPAPVIVMLTTEGDPDLIRTAKSAGAKAWIVKPFKPVILVATVRKLLGVA